MYLSVRVVAGAKKEKVEKVGENRLKIEVKQPAKQNLANKRVLELIAAYLKVPVSKVRMINGHQSPSKLFSVGE